MADEYRDILNLYEEFATKELKPKVLELDSPEESDRMMGKLEEMGAVSEEMNTLPVSVRVAAVMLLARGEGGIAVRVGTALAMLEYGMGGVSPVHGGILARGGEGRAYYSGKIGTFRGKEVQTVGLRGVRWFKGEFSPESDAPGNPEDRILLYDLAATVGVAMASYEEALGYAKERKAFGKPIYEYEEVRRFLNEGFSRLKAAESLLLSDGASPQTAVWQVVEAATFMTEKATQIFGGYGFINEYPVSKYMRDVRMLRSIVIGAAYV